MSERFAVPAALDGERLDRALALLTGRSRAELAVIVASGAVKVAGRVVTIRHLRVASGEVLDADLPPLRSGPQSPAPSSAVPFSVVFDDEDLIVVDKPAGLVVHPGAGHRDDTLVSGLLARYPDIADVAASGAFDASRPGIVHRLDKDTSGLMVVARTAVAYRSLVAQIESRQMGRVYVALALGAVSAEEGLIDAPIGRSMRDPTRMAVRPSGRAAQTTYRVTTRFSEPAPASLLVVTLHTGRTHQIRVHLSAIGHPVAGDSRYGGTLRALGLRRPFLHAARLRFSHPVSGEELQFDSPLPEDLSEVLGRLG